MISSITVWRSTPTNLKRVSGSSTIAVASAWRALGSRRSPYSVRRQYIEIMYRVSGGRPPFRVYLRDLWGRRHFIASYTRASNAAMYSNSFLGQVWQVLTPLLNAAVYFFIFGYLLKTKRSIPNYIGFLTIGIFVFTYMQNSIIHGSRSVTNNLNIIRALHFPRASLPLGTTAIALQQLLASMLAMLPIVLLTGEPVRWSWLLLGPIFFLESLFALGVALVVARI